MFKKAVFLTLTMLTIIALIGACAPAAPMSEVMEEVEAEAPAAEPAAPAEEGKPVGITVSNMQGVPEGKYPTQYELEEFESLTGTMLTFTDRGSIDPRL